jgi:branched-subunit amino acid ABC-type transport system permease component
VDAYLIAVIDGVAYGLLLAVAAAGLTLSIGAGGVLNLAHGVLVAAGAYVAVAVSAGTGGSLAVGLLAATVVGAAGGGAIAAGAVHLPVGGHLRQAVFTFGVALLGESVLTGLFGPDVRRPDVPAVLEATVAVAGRPYPLDRLAAVGVAVAVVVVGFVLLLSTRAGRVVRASVDDRAMVAAIGVDLRVVDTVLLVVSGALAGLSGALTTPFLGVGPRTAATTLALLMAIVICGGVGSVPGAVAAAVGVGLVQTVVTIAVPGAAPFLPFGLFGITGMVLLARRRPLLAWARS